MKPSAILTSIFLLTLILPMIGLAASVKSESQVTVVGSSTESLLEGVPYVWQEMNGFCAWAATSIGMQYAGVQLGLHELFALSSIGFSFAYVQFNDTMLMFPGAIYQQVEPTDFVADLYGLNLTVYLESSLGGAEEQVAHWNRLGINAGLLDGRDDAFSLMKRSIDEGYPLIASVDPSWLPAKDYDYLRQQGLTGGAHGVVIVGYDDNEGTATIIDPGVGSFGNNFGYPADGRGNYTKITYTSLTNAWSNRYYICMLIKPGEGKVEDFNDRVGPYLRDKLLGSGELYAPESASAYLWSFGESAFRAMASDITAQGLTSYLSIFDGVKDEQYFKSSLLLFIGLGLESQTTLQYLSYRSGLSVILQIMPDLDLTNFINAADDALPHFSALANNWTLVYPGNVTPQDSLISSTFHGIVEAYNTTGDLSGTLSQFSEELDTISGHLLGIADSWLAAGNALAEIWPTSPLIIYGPFIAVAAFAAAAIVVITIVIIRRTPSQ